MKKDSLICFRASKQLHELLTQFAKEDRRSMSSLIEMALNNYLKERKAFSGVEKERRQFPRKAFCASAVINLPASGLMGVGSIADISLSGVKVLIPKDYKQQIVIDSQGSKFGIVFNLPDNKLVRLSCESNKVMESEESINVGAFFTDADFKGYKALQSYLT
jgi:hypothetical protein